MSAFEVCCWNWYQRNASPLVFEAGLLARLIDRLRLNATTEPFFIRALGMIRNHMLSIELEDARK